MFRNLILFIAIFSVAWIVSRMLKKPASKQQPRDTSSEDMVKCEYCDTYLPKNKAIENNGHYFCSSQHLQNSRK